MKGVGLAIDTVAKLHYCCWLVLQNVYEQLPNRLTSSRASLDPLTLTPPPSAIEMRRLRPRRFFRYANGCASTFNAWTTTFKRLLLAHNFKPVPGLADVHVHWPHRNAVLRFGRGEDEQQQHK